MGLEQQFPELFQRASSLTRDTMMDELARLRRSKDARLQEVRADLRSQRDQQEGILGPDTGAGMSGAELQGSYEDRLGVPPGAMEGMPAQGIQIRNENINPSAPAMPLSPIDQRMGERPGYTPGTVDERLREREEIQRQMQRSPQAVVPEQPYGQVNPAQAQQEAVMGTEPSGINTVGDLIQYFRMQGLPDDMIARQLQALGISAGGQGQ